MLGLKALQNYKPDWENGGDWALYGMYYITQAKYQASVADYRAWLPVYLPLYSRNQNMDGSWSALKKSNENSHGSVYTTAMAIMTLDAYYGGRIPLMQTIGSQTNNPSSMPVEPNANDVIIRIL